MKILAAIRGCVGHGHIGGMELISHIVFKGLIDRGLDIEVLTSCKNSVSNSMEKEIIDGVPYIYLPTKEPCKYTLEFHREISIYFESVNNTISLILSVSGAGSSITKNEYNIPTIACWHGTFLEQELDKVFKYQYQDNKQLSAFNVERLVVSTILPRLFNGILKDYQSFDYHVCISPYMQEILGCYGLPPSRIKFIPNCLSSEFVKNIPAKTDRETNVSNSFGLSSDKFTIGIVGRMGKEKGEDIIRGLIPLLPPDKFNFLFVGSKIDLEDFTKKGFEARCLNLEHSQMSTAYQAMDVFVNPTLRLSGLDMTVLEAYACGTKVIVSNLPQYKGFAEAYGIKIKFFETGNTQSLVDAINNPTPNSVKDSLTEDFSEGAMVNSYIDLINTVVADHITR